MVSVIRPGRLRLLEVEIESFNRHFQKKNFFDFHVLSHSKFFLSKNSDHRVLHHLPHDPSIARIRKE